jgi:hypothetical protein
MDTTVIDLWHSANVFSQALFVILAVELLAVAYQVYLLIVDLVMVVFDTVAGIKWRFSHRR